MIGAHARFGGHERQSLPKPRREKMKRPQEIQLALRALRTAGMSQSMTIVENYINDLENQLTENQLGDNRTADKIDGYDRDDLGESPDY